MRVHFKAAWRSSAAHADMSADKFLARLCTLVPPPGFRARIIPPSPVPTPGQQLALGLAANDKPDDGDMQGRARRRSARSAGEQQDLVRRMRPGRRPCTVEDTGDVVGSFDDLEDAHPAAALATDGDVNGEHAGEELGPPDMTRYFGVFANRHHLRPRIIPPSPVPTPGQQLALALAGSANDKPDDDTESSPRPRRLGWAKLLARVFAVDINVCRKCGGRMRILEVVETADDIARVLHGARAPPRPHPPGQVMLFLG